tara:strand:+ start:392 stop:745 length:354 start_codon:yes stop_codon:yes gene_type:complete
MFGHIIKTIILTIFAIIIFHFIIEHTKKIWHIPNHVDYDASYKKIVDLLETIPDELEVPQIPLVPPVPQVPQVPQMPPSDNYISDVTEISKLDTYIPPPPPNESMETELSEYLENMT